MATSGRDHPMPSWRFAPTGIAAEQGNNPGQAHFANDALAQMVRETLQNSMDHPEPGLDTVSVTFRLIDVTAGDIQADQLARHISASLEEAQKGEDPDEENRLLQSAGFVAMHQGSPNSPVAGPDIPAPFQLGHSGTGVLIIGLDEERCPD